MFFSIFVFSSMLCCMCYVLQYVVLHVLCSPVCSLAFLCSPECCTTCLCFTACCVAWFMYFRMCCCVFIFYSMGCYMFYVFQYVVLHVLFSSKLCLMVYVPQNIVLDVYVLQCVVLHVLFSSKLCCMAFVTQNVVCLFMFASLLYCMFKVSVQITWNSTGRNGSLGSSSPSWNDFRELSQLENLLDHVVGNCAELCRYES